MNIQNGVHIIPYEDIYHEAFRTLNLEWLTLYGLAEEPDMRVLSDPRGEILSRGGFIWVAILDDAVIGTAALIKESDHSFELAKMSVAPGYRGLGIGRKLLETCIDKALVSGANRIELFSNHQLKSAVQLYERLGFRHIPVIDSPFQTADIKMELILSH